MGLIGKLYTYRIVLSKDSKPQSNLITICSWSMVSGCLIFFLIIGADDQRIRTGHTATCKKHTFKSSCQIWFHMSLQQSQIYMYVRKMAYVRYMMHIEHDLLEKAIKLSENTE